MRSVNHEIGKFEQIVLVALRILGENAYGISIQEEVEKLSKRFVSLGAVYTTLDRLEKKGYIETWFGPATPERGGRAKRQAKILKPGAAALNDSLRLATNMLNAVKARMGANSILKAKRFD